uniref:Uncharacterized protein n=1 Tax=Leersia perrieri TaxID=77586 RepID=A0A0D9WMZ7_9ORYZ
MLGIPCFFPGSATGGDGDHCSLPTATSAEDHPYLGGHRRGVFRPFGDAVLDGVDLYIDHGGPANYDVLVQRLAGYSGKPVVLTATPRCGYPDANAEAALATGLVRRIHPLFYHDTACTDYIGTAAAGRAASGRRGPHGCRGSRRARCTWGCR